MSDALPSFEYHPDPVGSGVVRAEIFTCGCCGQRRTHRYIGPVSGQTSEAIEDRLCLHCIADGSAAKGFDVEFADAHPLANADLTRDIIDAVTKRTPGYFSWQQDHWIAHCGDACAYHGDATPEDVARAGADTIAAWKDAGDFSDDDWVAFSHAYTKGGGSAAFYKFVCRHCGAVRLGFDLD